MLRQFRLPGALFLGTLSCLALAHDVPTPSQYLSADDGWQFEPAAGLTNLLHAGSFADPKLYGEITHRGAVHFINGAYFRSEFSGAVSARTPMPQAGSSTAEWTFLSLRAGTMDDPRHIGEPTYVGAYHLHEDTLYRSEKDGILSEEDLTTRGGALIIGAMDILYMTSDPQFPWTETPNESAETTKNRSRDFIYGQYDFIRAHRAPSNQTIPVIINGDLTAFGHGWQINEMKSQLSTLLGNKDIYPGLGNHDYANNVNDCANNGCARDSLLWFRSISPSLHRDQFVETGFQYEKYVGSMAYMQSYRNIGIYQLNNYPTYAATFSSGVVPFEKKRDFVIRPSVEWFANSLKNDASTYRWAMVNMHDVSHYDATFRSLLDANPKIKVVFGGHYHTLMGRWKNERIYGDVPVFLSGSASTETLLRVNHFGFKNELHVYGIRENGRKPPMLLCVIDTRPEAPRGCK